MRAEARIKTPYFCNWREVHIDRTVQQSLAEIEYQKQRRTVLPNPIPPETHGHFSLNEAVQYVA